MVDSLLKKTFVKPIEVATMALPAAMTSDNGISIGATSNDFNGATAIDAKVYGYLS
jgi:hypothetical protein